MTLGGVLFAVVPRQRCLLAKVAELVDALDLGSSGVTRESSSLSFRTIHARNIQKNELIHVMMGTYDRWVYPYNPITGF